MISNSYLHAESRRRCNGAPLVRLEALGSSQRYSGGSDLLVVEADESDGTLVKFSPASSGAQHFQ
jgi:UDP-N-acetylmuramate-alanine ligase